MACRMERMVSVLVLFRDALGHRVFAQRGYQSTDAEGGVVMEERYDRAYFEARGITEKGLKDAMRDWEIVLGPDAKFRAWIDRAERAVDEAWEKNRF